MKLTNAFEKTCDALKLFSYVDIFLAPFILKLLAQLYDPMSFKMNIEKLLLHENLGYSLAQEALDTAKIYSWDIKAQQIISFVTTHM